MKVADLIDDLESGDRTIEQLKTPPEPTGHITFGNLQDAINRASAWNLGNQLGQQTGAGLALGMQSQLARNNLWVQQAALVNYGNLGGL